MIRPAPRHALIPPAQYQARVVGAGAVLLQTVVAGVELGEDGFAFARAAVRGGAVDGVAVEEDHVAGGCCDDAGGGEGVAALDLAHVAPAMAIGDAAGAVRSGMQAQAAHLIGGVADVDDGGDAVVTFGGEIGPVLVGGKRGADFGGFAEEFGVVEDEVGAEETFREVEEGCGEPQAHPGFAVEVHLVGVLDDEVPGVDRVAGGAAPARIAVFAGGVDLGADAVEIAGQLRDLVAEQAAGDVVAVAGEGGGGILGAVVVAGGGIAGGVARAGAQGGVGIGVDGVVHAAQHSGGSGFRGGRGCRDCGMIPTLGVACDQLPEVILAGRYPLRDRNHATVYRVRGGHALHLHGYAGRWRLQGVTHVLRPGVMTMSADGTDTSYDLDQPGYHWCVHFRIPHGAVAVPAWLPLGPDAVYARTRLARIAALSDGMRGAVGPARARTAAAAGAALLELLLWLAERAERSPTRHQRSEAALERVAQLMREEPTRRWRTAALARRVGLSPNWLAKRFHGRFGMTIDQYRQAQQVELARMLLGSTALTVAAIGARVGIPDAQRFNKLVRAHLGLAPSAIRRRDAALRSQAT